MKANWWVGETHNSEVSKKFEWSSPHNLFSVIENLMSLTISDLRPLFHWRFVYFSNISTRWHVTQKKKPHPRKHLAPSCLQFSGQITHSKWLWQKRGRGRENESACWGKPSVGEMEDEERNMKKVSHRLLLLYTHTFGLFLFRYWHGVVHVALVGCVTNEGVLTFKCFPSK